ncbi:MAG: hypothetical protein ABJA34_11500 [Pseudonocardiales bacterium]
MSVASRRPDDEPPGVPPEWHGFVVPDDISELDSEIEQLRRELAAPRRPILQRVFETRRWQQYGLSGPLILVVLLVVLFFASLVFLLVPVAPRSPQSRPLAHPSAAVGAVGGLLPDLALPVGATGAVRLRTLRPAVVVVVPDQCDCAALIGDVISSTSAGRVHVLFVGLKADPRLPGTAPVERVRSASDAEGQLARAYADGSDVAGPTALFVRADGTVISILRNARAGVDIHQEVDAIASGGGAAPYRGDHGSLVGRYGVDSSRQRNIGWIGRVGQ